MGRPDRASRVMRREVRPGPARRGTETTAERTACTVPWTRTDRTNSRRSAVAVAAVALGAKIIEKHLILGRNLGGPDSQFSMEPHEFSAMAHDIRIAEKAVGTKSLGRDKKETKGRQFARSLFAVEDIKAGAEFTKINVRSIRPGYGLAPKYLNDIIGKRAKKDIERGTPLSFDLLM